MGHTKLPSFQCPRCGDRRNGCTDSRVVQNGTVTRRRRECANGHRFTTYERIEPALLPFEVIPGIIVPACV